LCGENARKETGQKRNKTGTRVARVVRLQKEEKAQEHFSAHNL
jgi:hypothetical protein